MKLSKKQAAIILRNRADDYRLMLPTREHAQQEPTAKEYRRELLERIQALRLGADALDGLDEQAQQRRADRRRVADQ